MKKNGITLIALVITVIVLLILAGAAVSIGLNGENVFEKADESKKMWNNGVIKEEVSFALNLYYNEPTLYEKLSHIADAEVENVNGLDDVCIVKKGDMIVSVYSDGNILDGEVEVWDGQAMSCPEFKQVEGKWFWYIYKPSQLKFLADFVNNGKTLTSQMAQMVTDAGYEDTSIVTINNNTEVYLMNNLDLGAREGNGATKEARWETAANESVRWTPIGRTNPEQISDTSRSFYCFFDGNNYTIKGVYVNESNSNERLVGLFGGPTGAVWNLNLTNSYIKGTNGVGGIAGLNTMIFENDHITNSTVISTGETAGGIVGGSWGHVRECSNDTTSVYGGRYVGGIIGQKSSRIKELKNCRNSGSVYGSSYAGGIVGSCIENIPITGCINTGDVFAINIVPNSSFNFGGICGSGIFNMSNCSNYGNINGYKSVGGIAGNIYYTDDAQLLVTLEKCYNNGLINGNASVGGIVGSSNNNGYTSDIASRVTVRECYNKGTVTGESSLGEVIGNQQNAESLNTLNKLYYLKNNSELTAIGGEADDPSGKKVTWTTDDLTYDAFLTWINSQ